VRAARSDKGFAQALEIARRGCIVAPVEQRLAGKVPRGAVIEMD